MDSAAIDLALSRAREVVGRDDSYLTEDRVREFLATGGWTPDTFVDLLDGHAVARSGAPAVIEANGSALTWAELADRSRRLASALVARGYRRGDTLAMQLPNWPEFCVLVMGAARAGIRPVFIHTPYRGFEMEYILGLCQARGLVVPGRYRGTDHVALGRTLQARLPGLRDLIVVRPEPGQAVGGVTDLADLLVSGGSFEPAEPVVATDIFVLMFTSGTTSRPKGVMHLHANLLNACRKYVGAYGLTPDDRWLIVTPLTHLTAFGIALLGGGLAPGGSSVLLESWDAARALELAERHRVTHVVGAPPMLIDMARSPDLGHRDLSALRFIMYAGAPCPIEILRRLHDRLGCDLAVFYGWTEGLAHTYTVPSDPLEVTSVTIGRTGEGWEWRVVGEDGRDVAPGEQGEFWGRGPNLSPGYFHQAEFMPERFHPDGWFMSGDLVTLNPDGTYTFVSRKDDVINRGGLKVDPREVEELLYQLPQVADAVVVGVPDARLGQRGCAFVVLAPGASLTLPDIQAHLEAAGLAKYKWPERLELVDALPMTATGKIMRYELRGRAEAG